MFIGFVLLKGVSASFAGKPVSDQLSGRIGKTISDCTECNGSCQVAFQLENGKFDVDTVPNGDWEIVVPNETPTLVRVVKKSQSFFAKRRRGFVNTLLAQFSSLKYVPNDIIGEIASAVISRKGTISVNFDCAECLKKNNGVRYGKQNMKLYHLEIDKDPPKTSKTVKVVDWTHRPRPASKSGIVTHENGHETEKKKYYVKFDQPEHRKQDGWYRKNDVTFFKVDDEVIVKFVEKQKTNLFDRFKNIFTRSETPILNSYPGAVVAEKGHNQPKGTLPVKFEGSLVTKNVHVTNLYPVSMDF